jgi:hypothetical protein
MAHFYQSADASSITQPSETKANKGTLLVYNYF